MCFEAVKKNFGFGCMRLPMTDGQLDIVEICKMVDAFLENGFNYFDTAHGYLEGKSELALKECLTSRYPRDRYVLTNKLSGNHFSSESDIRPLFEHQLECCGVDYFDFYLMHAQNRSNFEKYKQCRAYETAFELKREGKIKCVGLSFHDTADVLDKILSEYPMIEAVQIQLNYADFDDVSVQSGECYRVCRKHNKPVIVMEPVKGGALVNLPDAAKRIFDELGGGSYASYAIRYAASFEGVKMVLSGMSNMQMMNDNISYMKDFKALDGDEQRAVERVCEIFRAQNLIPCTSCRYCTERCPVGIAIPDMFGCLNAKKQWNAWSADFYYNTVYGKNSPKASDCIGCGLCEESCPQHLSVRELLKQVAAEFEKGKE